MFETIVISLVTTGSGYFLGWLFARRKNKADADMSELEVINRRIETWQGLTTDLREELETLRKENGALRRAVIRLEKAIHDAKKCVSSDSCPILNGLNSLQDEQTGNR
jgi:predicted  nucleic acid-binding Zn-ribbon protein